MENRKTRNIGIIAHVDAGKTTLSERILYYSGAKHRPGEVHDGKAEMDFDPQERKRGITINSAATTVYWHGARITLIDTPGHIDFNIEVKRALRVLDGAVVVFDSVAGVEPQTETNWRLADLYQVPRIAFINKMDRVGADFYRTVAMMEQRLGTTPLLLQIPIGSEEHFHGVVDLLSQQAWTWPEDGLGVMTEGPIPAELVEEASRQRARLLDLVLAEDDALLGAWLEGQQPSVAELSAAIRRGTLRRAFVPVLAGAAYRNKGVEPLLDAVVAYLPEPGEVSDKHELGLSADGPLAALAFKTVSDEHGTLTYLRLYRGQLSAGDSVVNAHTGQRERVARVYEMHADKKLELAHARAGDIVAVAGLKATTTGDTVCAVGHVLSLESIEAPEPVLDIAVEAKTAAEQAQLLKGLQALVAEDPSLRLRHDAESGQTLLCGMGELQLEVTLEKLRQRYNVEAHTGRPQVAYRETLTRAVTGSYLHRKQTGGPGQYAEVALRIAPLTRGSGVQFHNAVVGGVIPREFIPAVEAGVRRAVQTGVAQNYPVVDIEVTLTGGSFHERDSSSASFESATVAAMRELMAQAGPVVLEPVMAVEVVTPTEHVGACIGDLNRRRGLVRRQEIRGTAMVIDAEVPLAAMFGYIGQLRALTAGRANYSMQFAHYAEAVNAVAAH